MRELKRLCLPCAGKLQDGGIRCEIVGDGVRGMCPHCKKKRLCYNWKVERRERFTSPALRAPSPQGEGYKEGD